MLRKHTIMIAVSTLALAAIGAASAGETKDTTKAAAGIVVQPAAPAAKPAATPAAGTAAPAGSTAATPAAKPAAPAAASAPATAPAAASTPAAKPAAPAAASAPAATPAPASAAPAQAAGSGTPCEEVKAKITEKMTAKGAKNFTLEALPKDEVKDAKVVGSCEGGTKKVVYRKN